MTNVFSPWADSDPYRRGHVIRAEEVNVKFEGITTAFDELAKIINQRVMLLPGSFDGNNVVDVGLVANTLLHINAEGNLSAYSLTAFENNVALTADYKDAAYASANSAGISLQQVQQLHDQVVLLESRVTSLSQQTTVAKDTAVTKAGEAAASASSANDDKIAAANSASSANDDKIAAAGSASTAANHESNAKTYRDEALSYRNTASSHKDAAAGYASSASTSAGSASNSASTATTQATLAEKWAQHPENTAVESGKYSAYHWAQKAQEYAGGVDYNWSAIQGKPALVTSEPMVKGTKFVARNLEMVNGGSSYRRRVVLLFPVQEASTPSDRRVVGKLLCIKNGSNIFDSVEVNTQSNWNNTFGHISTVGQNPQNFKLVTCTYNAKKWLAIEVNYQANPYNAFYFYGLACSDLDESSQLDVVAYYDTQNNVVVDSEINSSISDFTAASTGVFLNGNQVYSEAHKPTWGEVQSKPSTFPPSSHGHSWSEISGRPVYTQRWPTPAEINLGNVPNIDFRNYGLGTQAPSNNEAHFYGTSLNTGFYNYGSVSDLGYPSVLALNGGATDWRLAFYAVADRIEWHRHRNGVWTRGELYHTGNKPSWGEVTGKPSTFTPSSHSHSWGDLPSYKTTQTEIRPGGKFYHKSDVGSGGFIDHAYSLTTTGSPRNGAIEILVPSAASTDMITFWVDVFDYTNNESFSVFIAGYNYQTSGNNWVNETAFVLSAHGKILEGLPVRFGARSDGRKTVWIGDTGKVWSYPQVTIRDVHAAYNASASHYASGWGVGFATSFHLVERTINGTGVIGDQPHHIYNSSVTLNSGRYTTRHITWSGSPTVTIDGSTFPAGAVIEVINQRGNGTVTITCNDGTIYLPNGTNGSTHTLSKAGTVKLVKHDTSTSWMAQVY